MYLMLHGRAKNKDARIDSLHHGKDVTVDFTTLFSMPLARSGRMILVCMEDEQELATRHLYDVTGLGMSIG